MAAQQTDPARTLFLAQNPVVDGTPQNADTDISRNSWNFSDLTEKTPGESSTPGDFPTQYTSSTQNIPSTQCVPSTQCNSSVRLRVDDATGHSWGTGTIIDAKSGQALILTCGHIFRESQGKGAVEVHLFGNGSEYKALGQCLHYDLETDLGFIVVSPPCPVRVSPLIGEQQTVVPGMSVLSVGCDSGSNPTVREHRILSLDRIRTPAGNAVPFHYIQVSGAPVGGRSGGGLFTKEGYLIGVCNTADPDADEGHFVPPHIIRQQLDRRGLSIVHQRPSISDPTRDSRTASNPQDRPVVEAPRPATLIPMPSNPIATPAPSDSVGALERTLIDHRLAMDATERATLDEINRRRQDVDEVILIIRSRRNPETPTDVIKLENASTAFLNALTNKPPVSGDPDHPAVPLTVSFPVTHTR
ncbi:MAG TPA: hypothetical protein DEB39_12655 [Planctomycetaceae bacterium]|nr:hypothetical protein [Planctomycetaceae bacterium]